MGAGDHNLEHTSLNATYIVDEDTQALPDAISLGSYLLTGRHDTFYAFGFVEVQQPATGGIFAGECAEADFADPVFELLVQVLMFGFADTLQDYLFGRLCRDACKDER